MKTLPRLNIAQLPTPIEPLPRLSAELAGPNLFVKRDDQTGLAFGGNKTRKLEFLLADARQQGAEMVLSAGALQSNHCRQTAAAAARFGFGCTLVLYPTEDTQSTLQRDPTANLLLDQLFGAEIIITNREKRDEILQQTFDSALSNGKNPYLIPYGGSNVLGAYSYALAVKELIAWSGSADWIVFPSSSGGTQAGLVLGARLFDFQGKILGISVDEPADDLQQRISSLANKTADFLGEKIAIKPDEILVNADYLGGGYGIMGDVELDAIRCFARMEGLLLDPVYTGRAGAGLIDLIRRGFFKPDDNVVFWHTGGTPALFADQYRSRLASSA